MALEKYTDEQLKKMSMIELAVLVMGDAKEEMNFADLFREVAELKSFNDSDKENQLASFYTDLNVDGRFMALGSNVWGLKRWYPVDQTTEKSLAESRKRDMEEELLEDGEEEEKEPELGEELEEAMEEAPEEYDNVDYDE